MNTIIGNNLKKFREKSGFSLEQAATLIEINETVYMDIEDGKITASLDVLEKLSNLYGSNLDSVFEEKVNVADCVLACSFRVDDLNSADLNEIASFKEIVKNYLKMNTLLGQCQQQ